MTTFGRFIQVNREIDAITDRMKERKEQGSPTEALRAKLQRHAGWIDLEAADLSRESILAPFLTKPSLPMDVPSRRLPVITPAETLSVAPKAERAGGLVLLVGDPQTDVDTPLEQLPVLPAASVASALSAVGLVGPADGPLELTSLLTDGATFEHLKGWAVAWTAVSRNRLRTVTIRALDASAEEWKSLLLPLREFAASIDATLD